MIDIHLPRAACVLALFVSATLFAATPPATVTGEVKEADLPNLKLTAQAEQRLGVTAAPVEKKPVRQTRFFAGDLILPMSVNDGASGTNSMAQSVAGLLPTLTPADLIRLAQSQIDADAQIDQAIVQRDIARIALSRAEQVLKDQAGSVRAVDEARAQVGVAEAGVRRAQAQRQLLGAPALGTGSPAMLWLRVPVYAGDFDRLDLASEALVARLGGGSTNAPVPAKPVSAPPSANGGASTVDLFYSVANAAGLFRVGQKVGVVVPLKDEENGLVLPWSAVVQDAQGGTWVSENPSPQLYVRRRVHVSRVQNHEAQVVSGIREGARVAVQGVAELFGAEMGVGK
jgi:multidrug efflux pump subunit AcrA (membrane-fusion protein)